VFALGKGISSNKVFHLDSMEKVTHIIQETLLKEEKNVYNNLIMLTKMRSEKYVYAVATIYVLL